MSDDSKMTIQVLSPTYFKNSFVERISLNDPSKNINNLQIFALDNKINIKWADCPDPNWKSNIIVRAENNIPLCPYEDKIIETTYTKNAYTLNSFIDSDIEPNKLYCYRIFTEFKNSDEFYSGLKNIVFIYVSLDGISGNIPIIASGTYTKVTINSQGKVIGGATLIANDIPDITLDKITNAGTAASKNIGISAGNIPIVNDDGKLDSSIIPITEYTLPTANSTIVGGVKQGKNIQIDNDGTINSNPGTGDNSVAEGQKTVASGNYTHAEGNQTNATGLASHAEGSFNTASGVVSHVEGTGTIADNAYAHAEGNATKAHGQASHSEGYMTIAKDSNSHAEGSNTQANGYVSHAENNYTKANGMFSHTEGDYSITNGVASHAEGENTVANGDYSHAEGAYSVANGIAAHSEGESTQVTGIASHVEGQNSIVNGDNSHGEGYSTFTYGDNSHSEGYITSSLYGTSYNIIAFDNTNKTLTLDNVINLKVDIVAYIYQIDGKCIAVKITAINSNVITIENVSGDPIIADKYKYLVYNSGNKADGNMHVEGYNNLVVGKNSHAEGCQTIVNSDNSHSEGYQTIASYTTLYFITSYNIDNKTLILTDPSNPYYIDMSKLNTGMKILIGNQYSDTKEYTIATVDKTNKSITVNESLVLDNGNHCEFVIIFTPNKNCYNHVEGYQNIAGGDASHAEGYKSIAAAYGTHVEGQTNIATGICSHAEGANNKAFGSNCHVEGTDNISREFGSHAEGQCTEAVKPGSHSEGGNTVANGYNAHAEGNCTLANADYSHAEGDSTTTTAYGAHAEGRGTKAIGQASHSEGLGTTADNCASHVSGKYNKPLQSTGSSNNQLGDAFVIGNGYFDSSSYTNVLSNAFRVTYKGEVYGTQAYNASGADYAEYFEWLDGNPNNEDRRGYFVTLDGDKIKIASTEDYILGVISSNPSVIGNADEDWLGKYLHDDFGGFIYEDIEEMQEQIDPNTNKVTYIKTGNIIKNGRLKLNPNYDSTKTYVPRSERKEWTLVGMMGVLAVKDDGTCEVNKFCKPDTNGIATNCDKTSDIKYRVIKRINNNIILVILK